MGRYRHTAQKCQASHKTLHYFCRGLITKSRHFFAMTGSITLYFMTPQGTQRTQIVMDYDDFSRVMEEFTDKVADKIKASASAPSGKDDGQELMTAKEVRIMIGVTDKTLHVWHKTGFLPRIRIGGVVRYRREDVERAAQVKSK